MVGRRRSEPPPIDPRLRIVDAALAFAVERRRGDLVIDVLLDIRNNVLRDMTNEPPSGGSLS